MKNISCSRSSSPADEFIVYADVPPEVFQGLLEAESKGQYMRAYIIDVYPYRRGPCRKKDLTVNDQAQDRRDAEGLGKEAEGLLPCPTVNRRARRQKPPEGGAIYLHR